MSHTVGTEPPLPRLITLPSRRVCGCGQIFTRPEEQLRGHCDVCDARGAIRQSLALAKFFPKATTILTPDAFRAIR